MIWVWIWNTVKGLSLSRNRDGCLPANMTERRLLHVRTICLGTEVETYQGATQAKSHERTDEDFNPELEVPPWRYRFPLGVGPQYNRAAAFETLTNF